MLRSLTMALRRCSSSSISRSNLSPAPFPALVRRFTTPAAAVEESTMSMPAAASSSISRSNLSPATFPALVRRFSTPVGGDTTAAAAAEEEEEDSTVAMPAAAKAKGDGDGISLSEVKRLMRLVNVEALKTKLAEEGKEVIGYPELLKACESMGVTRSPDEAAAFARVLDDAGVVLLFRDKVYLHPDKVVDLVRRSVPLALTPEDDPRREELEKLQERKEEIDRQAHKQVRVILWSGLGVAVLQVGLFFRLTFWEFSWDVMEPIAFFTTTAGIVIGYAYFMFTSKDPSYQDLMKTLFLSRQRKLIKRHNFDLNRFKELRMRCKCPTDKKKMNNNILLEDA